MCTWRNQRMPSVVILLLTLLTLHAAAFPTVDEFAARLKPLAQNTTVQADYTQTRHFKDLEFDVVTKGTMVQEQGKRLAWKTVTPLKSACIFTQDSFKFWEEETKHTTSLNASRFPWIKMIFQLQTNWMNGELASLQKLCQLDIVEETSLRLTPLDQAAKMFFSDITITFSKDYSAVEKVLFTEKSGDTIAITFQNVRFNAPIPPETWRLP